MRWAPHKRRIPDRNIHFLLPARPSGLRGVEEARNISESSIFTLYIEVPHLVERRNIDDCRLDTGKGGSLVRPEPWNPPFAAGDELTVIPKGKGEEQ